MKKAQLDKLVEMLSKKEGATSAEIARRLPSVCPHRRITDLKKDGWTILKKQDGPLKRYWIVQPIEWTVSQLGD